MFLFMKTVRLMCPRVLAGLSEILHTGVEEKIWKGI